MASADGLEIYDQAYVPAPFGLNNTGVICHLNALLQGLVGCSSVVRTAFARRDYLGRTATGRAFYDLIYAAVPAARPPGSEPFTKSAPLGGASAAVLAALVSDLRARRPNFNYGPRQESASEGLVLLLDMLDDPDPKTVGYDESTGAAICEENPVARLFYHRYHAAVYCKDCKKAVSSELDVAVQFALYHFDGLRQKPQTPAEFGELMRSQVSFLEDYCCEQCGKKAGGYRHYVLRMLPEVLVTLFNNYDDARARVARYAPARITFPGAGGKLLIYRQVAQIEHSGSREGGHYTARGLRADGRVYRLNDSAVSLSEFASTPEVYMLIYHCESAGD